MFQMMPGVELPIPFYFLNVCMFSLMDHRTFEIASVVLGGGLMILCLPMPRSAQCLNIISCVLFNFCIYKKVMPNLSRIQLF